MHRRLALSILTFFFLVTLSGMISTGAWSPKSDVALVLISVPNGEALAVLEQSGFPVYEWLYGADSDYVLAGMPSGDTSLMMEGGSADRGPGC